MIPTPKSSLIKFIENAAPRARYVVGRAATSAGITASVVKDEFIKGWALEAGAIVLASGGYLLLDEMDKMSEEDTSAMHEAMAQQTVTIHKANIHATLQAQTSVLAAANPKFGRFDPYQPIAAQIDLPPALINRFDLIFTIKDLPDELICSECILSFKIAMGNGKNEGKSEEQIIHEYVQDDYQIFSICLDCAGQV